ncbi:MAG: bifunctional 5,10-methylene-tetrahydrofolate dehydrogenase/5,10-methylene-tetrahydrofolate cyclohydrolase, partial [Flammeovirgaceae bacterium]|nr:bifunctional 5,10-methylene-tetrahydrofolate dehydrogenase/5,10-methylene-tetrahydrofolate cyclohydrolase [Flammeovirgaceae bacterium]
MQLIDGKSIAEIIKQEIATEVAIMKAAGKKQPHLVA